MTRAIRMTLYYFPTWAISSGPTIHRKIDKSPIIMGRSAGPMITSGPTDDLKFVNGRDSVPFSVSQTIGSFNFSQSAKSRTSSAAAIKWSFESTFAVGSFTNWQSCGAWIESTKIQMTDPTLYLQESGWEELRKEARKIEGDLDVKLSSYAKLGSRFTQGGSLCISFFYNLNWTNLVLFALILISQFRLERNY